ncbi:hypothetical protein NL676_012763 [Syzygium grande]|nr:hypothetical protein NL676_012763 [Syzygium grande]
MMFSLYLGEALAQISGEGQRPTPPCLGSALHLATRVAASLHLNDCLEDDEELIFDCGATTSLHEVAMTHL